MLVIWSPLLKTAAERGEAHEGTDHEHEAAPDDCGGDESHPADPGKAGEHAEADAVHRAHHHVDECSKNGWPGEELEVRATHRPFHRGHHVVGRVKVEAMWYRGVKKPDPW